MQESLNIQKDFFLKNATRDINFRVNQLKKLKSQIKVYYDQILIAYKKDLNKSEHTILIDEMFLVMNDLSYMIKKIKQISKPKNMPVGLLNFGAKSKLINEPCGCVLICCDSMTPILHTFMPIIGAIAGGNTATVLLNFKLKNIIRVIKKILDVFEEEYIFVTENQEEIEFFKKQSFDLVFMPNKFKNTEENFLNEQKLAPKLIYEESGVNPCIIDEDCDIDYSVKSVVEAKFLNAGLSQNAPDYVLVHSNIKEVWLEKAIDYIKHMYYIDGNLCEEYAKSASKSAVESVLTDVNKNKIVFGGKFYDGDILEPTILCDATQQIYRSEGGLKTPILNVIEFDELNQELARLKTQKRPLFLYYFGKDKEKINNITKSCDFYTCCINGAQSLSLDTKLVVNSLLSGNTGICRGKQLFYMFTRAKTVIKKEGLLKKELLNQINAKKYIKLFKKALGL
ncbi:MAG: aldehyde dehydrogenase family protein [Clostridia bacterium]|nr:aldehyde dehydrogenase family protein [Clostridia bacterium]